MDQPTSSLTRRDLLKLGGTALAGGASVVPGTQPIENDLAESWERQGDTVYVFKLKKGVRWHNKPPVNGRELTAEDVKYTYERFLTIKGNGNKTVLEMIDKIEAVDKYTVKFTLREPNAWFIDRLASTTTWVVARESVEQHGDLRKPESVIGTGPWMLQRYEPNVRISFTRHPNYFVPGLPHADGVEIVLSSDPAAGFAAFLAGEYDFGPAYAMVIRRSDLDVAQSRIKGLGTRDYIVLFGGITAMKIDQEPFKDVRVRRAFAMADNWHEILETNAWSMGKGVPNPLIPATLKEWTIPIGQLPPEGRALYEFDPKGARKLLAEAGYPNDLKVPIETTPGYGPDWMDAVQVALRNWKLAGIEGDLKLKEYGAFVTSAVFGKFDKMMLTPPRSHHRSRQLLRKLHARRAAQLLRGQRPQADRDDQAPAPDLRREETQGHRLGHPALCLPDRLLRLRRLGERGRRLDALREELRPQHRPRLRRPFDGRLAR